MRISAAGGPVTEETALNATEGAVTHSWPQFLADGRRFLYWQRSSKPEFQAIYVKTLGAPETTRVLATSGMAVAVPGYLLTVRDQMLFAHPFDEGLLQTTGEPIRVANQVGEFGRTGRIRGLHGIARRHAGAWPEHPADHAPSVEGSQRQPRSA